jgi:hypothetical protein
MKYIIEKENTMTTRPAASEYASYYERYVSLVPEAAILPVLERQTADLRQLVGDVRPNQETFRYAPNKWSVREVLGHIIDGERVFGYRAFCISRGERSPLPSFDENEYIRASAYNTIPLVSPCVLLRSSSQGISDTISMASGVSMVRPCRVAKTGISTPLAEEPGRDEEIDERAAPHTHALYPREPVLQCLREK